MKIHVKECQFCKRISLRVDGDQNWCHLRQGGYLAALKETHEVMSVETISCAECQRVIVHAAGSVT